jgi:NTP pyrophosphatase (non-canonical NTP hydrolase)
MPLNEIQKDVDNWTAQFTPQYWPIFEQLAHLVEEVGETSRELNHAFGVKKKKPSEAEKNVSKELVDVLFTVVCIANTLKIDLSKEWQEMMQVRRYGRDNNRFEKKI